MRATLALACAMCAGGCTDVGPVDDPAVFRVIGRDFRWHFHATGPDGHWDTSDDLALGSSLQIDTPHPVRLLITSHDYIYSFRIPQLRINEMAIPELEFEVLLTPTPAGRFELPVDPMCGLRNLHQNKIMGVLEVMGG